MIRSVIFDMDGLMFDTERLYVRALEEYVGPKTGVAFPRENVLKTLGCNNADFLRMFPVLFGTAITPQVCAALVTEWMTKEILANGVPVKPGLMALLDALKADGIRIALATGTSRHIALEYLERTDTLRYFDAFAFGDQVAHGKPDPEIFLLACEALGATPETTAVFEDSVNGLKAAHAGGFFSICVPDLVDPLPYLDFTPDAMLRSLDEAIPLIRSRNARETRLSAD
ncbi:MAG: HAD family phosphatase [Clostridia bacterium]|nr:HAD family phosphatase [Clostridia bacterium]